MSKARRGGSPLKIPEVRPCAACGTLLRRKMFGRRLEDLTQFETRKYCNRACMAIGQRKSR
jgi:hypothetical protein